MNSITLKPLDSQVVVITGASSGIGLVTAKAFASKGAKVLLIARSDDALAQAVREIEAAGGTADHVDADVGDAQAMKDAAARAVARFGRIDTWVNNAGSVVYADVLDTPLDEQQQLFRTNYFGVVHGVEAAVPHLRAEGGAIITVGSLASDMPAPPMGIYSATKHAVKAYIAVLRMELAANDVPISISLVKPAGIDTPIGQHAQTHGHDGEAQIPPPAYDPQIVADAILDCAVNPRREITVGGVGRMQVLFSQHFPALYELLTPRSVEGVFDKSKPQPKPSNLFEGAQAGRERSGEHPARMRHSIYTSAALHPGVTALGVGALIAGGVTLWARRRPSVDG